MNDFLLPEHFKDIFTRKLLDALRSGKAPGLFLALAYAAIDDSLRFTLDDEIMARLQAIASQPLAVDKSLAGRLSHFLNVTASRGASYEVADFRSLECFELGYTPYRLQRPGNSIVEHPNVRTPRQPGDRSFLDLALEETLYRGRFLGFECLLALNLFPAWKGAGLIFPDCDKEPREQFLLGRDHELFSKIASSSKVPGFRVIFNSYRAHASMPCLHGQFGIFASGGGVENPNWLHNGGGQRYPIDVFTSSSPDLSYSRIRSLQDLNIPHSVAYGPDGRCWVCARQAQGKYDLSAFSTGLATAEILLGYFVVKSRSDLATLSERDIIESIAKAGI